MKCISHFHTVFVSIWCFHTCKCFRYPLKSAYHFQSSKISFVFFSFLQTITFTFFSLLVISLETLCYFANLFCQPQYFKTLKSYLITNDILWFCKHECFCGKAVTEIYNYLKFAKNILYLHIKQL